MVPVEMELLEEDPADVFARDLLFVVFQATAKVRVAKLNLVGERGWDL